MSVFDDMTVFVRAVEVGSFSGAAQQLGIAKSIVSRRILSLESRLGTSMFHRSTRRLSLTEKSSHSVVEISSVTSGQGVARASASHAGRHAGRVSTGPCTTRRAT